MSVSLEYGCEVTYPVGEGTLAGLMIASAQIASAAFVLSSGVILDGASQNTDMIFGLAMAYMMIVACICGLLTNGISKYIYIYIWFRGFKKIESRSTENYFPLFFGDASFHDCSTSSLIKYFLSL